MTCVIECVKYHPQQEIIDCHMRKDIFLIKPQAQSPTPPPH